MPATTVSAELLLMFIALGAAPGATTTPTGWSIQCALTAVNGGGPSVIVYKLKAAGTEGGTTVGVTTTNTCTAAAHTFRITGWQGTLATAVVSGTPVAAAATTTPDPPSASWTFGAQDVLAIESVGGGGLSGATALVSAYSTNYANGADTKQAAFQAEIATAYRQITGATSPEDPGTLTLNASIAVVANTVVVLSTIGTAQALTASLTGAGTVAGALKQGLLLKCALAGAGTVAPVMKRGVLMKTSLAGAGAIAPALKRGVLLKTSLIGAGSLAAVIAEMLKASLSGAGTVSGALLRGAGLRAALAGAGAVAPAMTAGRGFRASLTGVGVVAAVLRRGVILRASLSGVGTLNAVLTQVIIVIVPTRQRPRIYIHDGATLHRIAQLTEVTDLNRSYALREHVRTASFTMGLSDPALAYTGTLAANVIVIESTEYPLPWVGRIVDREGKPADRTVTITADSYDAILGERFLPSDFTTEGATGSAFRRILGRLNGMNTTGIGLGYVEDGAAAPMSLSNTKGSDALDKLAEVAGMEWWLSYALDGPTLVILANLARERGADLYSSVVLTGPDGNFEVEGWRESGRANAYAQTVVGGEFSPLQTFVERERAVALRDGQSIRSDTGTQELVVEAQRVLRFGHLLAGETSFIAPTQRRELLAVREELKEAGITGEVAEQLLQRRRLPSQVILGRAYPDERNTWQYLEPGNVVHLVAGDAFIDGYDGPAVIVATQPMEHQRFIDVVVEVA